MDFIRKSTLLKTVLSGLCVAGVLAAVPAQAGYRLADNLTLSAKFFGDLTFSDNDADTGYHIKRSYITLKSKLDDRTKVRISLDQRDEDQSGTKGGVFVKYAYLDYMLDGNNTARVGLVNTPYVGFDESRFWGYRFIATTFTDFWKAQTSADIGASLMGGMRDGQVEYQLSLLNGEGYGNKTNGDGFALAGRANIDLGRIQVGGFFHEEKGRNGIADYDPSRLGAFAFYENERFRVGGQFLLADDNLPAASPVAVFDSGSGFNVQGRITLPKLADYAFARYDRLDRKDNGNEESLLILGVSKQVNDRLIIAPNLRKQDLNGTNGSVNIIAVHAQLKL